ncbi:MAG: efflux RND transporter permease subunit [Alphaproteobacteria bacterium]
MIGIVDWAVKANRLMLAIIIVVVVAGVASLLTIPKEADPDIPIPYIYVSVYYPGASPEDVERLIIRPLETQLKSIEGVKKLSAIGSLGFGSVLMEFDINFKKEKALEDVRAAVQLARGQIPQEAEEPTVHEINVNQNPVIYVNLSGALPERTILHAAKDLRDLIKGLPSVLDVELSGQREDLLEVVVDPAKLEGYGLTQSELLSAIARNNQLIPAGVLDTGRGRFPVKVSGLVQTPQDVLGLVLKSNNTSVVTLGDIAEVRRTFQDRATYSNFNGKPSITLAVTKRTGANLIDTTKRVRRVVAETQKFWPPGLKVDLSGDVSKFIGQQLGSLSDSIILAVILVMIVVVAALGLRSGLLVGFAIPTTFFISFLVLSMLGMTLNFMIMFAMLLAVGILVDGAIIVVEYADRKMAEGLTPREAFLAAGRRMFWPVVSATATMLAAFLPMLLWPGVPGKFMSYFPITLIIVLSASMFVALTFLPVIGGIFGKAPHFSHDEIAGVEASETGDWREIPGITGQYAHLVERATRHPWKVFGAGMGIAVAVIALFVVFNHGVTFFVDTDPDEATVAVSARGNLSADEKRNFVFAVEKAILPVDGIESVTTRTGGGGQSLGNNALAEDTIGRIYVQFKDYKERRKGRDIIEDLRARTRDFPGLRVEVREPQSGPSSGKPISIELTSNNIAAILATTAKVRDHLDTVQGLRDVEDTRPLPGIEWSMQIDREQAGLFGADVVTIGTAIQLVTNGVLVAKYRPDDSDDEVDIRARYPLIDRGINALDTLRVSTRYGLVPVSNFVKRVPEQQVNSIRRIDSKRVYYVRAGIAPSVNANAKIQEIQDWLKKANLSSDVRVKFGGANEEQDASAMFLLFTAIPAMLFLISAVLLAMFNSFYSTALVLFAVFLAWIGSLLGMVVMGHPFSVIMTGTGMLALAGIVVNHNIVLIDTYQRLYRGGMDRIEAIIRSSAQRLRPVFLTTVTAILGLLPMMFAVEISFFRFPAEVTVGAPAALWWIGLSTAVIFGLAFSKAITLGLVPAMLAMPVRWRERRAEKRAKRDGGAKYVDGTSQKERRRKIQAAE